jgi:hypothetical protein
MHMHVEPILTGERGVPIRMQNVHLLDFKYCKYLVESFASDIGNVRQCFCQLNDNERRVVAYEGKEISVTIVGFWDNGTASIRGGNLERCSGGRD